MKQIALLLALAACESHQPSTSQGPATHQVTIKGMKYDPAELTIAPGDTVIWTNQDIVQHTVTEPGVFDSQAISNARQWKRTFDKPGVYPYSCTFHPMMTAKITVR